MGRRERSRATWSVAVDASETHLFVPKWTPLWLSSWHAPQAYRTTVTCSILAPPRWFMRWRNRLQSQMVPNLLAWGTRLLVLMPGNCKKKVVTSARRVPQALANGHCLSTLLQHLSEKAQRRGRGNPDPWQATSLMQDKLVKEILCQGRDRNVASGIGLHVATRRTDAKRGRSGCGD